MDNKDHAKVWLTAGKRLMEYADKLHNEKASVNERVAVASIALLAMTVGNSYNENCGGG